MCLPVWNILKSRLYLLQKLTFYGCTYFVGCFSILVEWTTDFDYKTLNKPLDHHHLHHTTCKQPDTQRQRSSKPELCPPVASALSSLSPSIPHLTHAVKKTVTYLMNISTPVDEMLRLMARQDCLRLKIWRTVSGQRLSGTTLLMLTFSDDPLTGFSSRLFSGWLFMHPILNKIIRLGQRRNEPERCNDTTPTSSDRY